MIIETNLNGPLLYRLRSQYKLQTFVETGTASGATTELAALVFDHVYTIEISPHQIQQQKANARLAYYTNVTQLFGHSPDVLREVRKQLTTPTLFWLDAHWCGGPRTDNMECPVLDELKSLEGLSGSHVILIDDARLFVTPPPPPHRPEEWPTMMQIREAVGLWNPAVEFSIAGDIIVLEPGAVS